MDAAKNTSLLLRIADTSQQRWRGLEKGLRLGIDWSVRVSTGPWGQLHKIFRRRIPDVRSTNRSTSSEASGNPTPPAAEDPRGSGQSSRCVSAY